MELALGSIIAHAGCVFVVTSTRHSTKKIILIVLNLSKPSTISYSLELSSSSTTSSSIASLDLCTRK
jgi:hypothetical protein